MWTIGIWKVQLWHWFSWSLVLPIPSLASWKLAWKKNPLIFIINKAMFTCWKNLGNLRKSWRCNNKNSRNIQKLLYFSPHQSSRSRNTRWDCWGWKLKNRPQNSGTLGRKLTTIWWKTCRLFALMQKCKFFEWLGPQSFCNFMIYRERERECFVWWEYRRLLWSNGRKSNFFKRLNTTLTMSREPWWWAAQLV